MQNFTLNIAISRKVSGAMNKKEVPINKDSQNQSEHLKVIQRLNDGIEDLLEF